MNTNANGRPRIFGPIGIFFLPNGVIGDLLDSPFGLGNANFCWPPPGVESVTQGEDDRKAKGGKKRKPGIIYLSSIPNGYNVSRTTGFFSQFGRVGRVFLQPGNDLICIFLHRLKFGT